MSEKSADRSRFPFSVILIVIGALLLFGNFEIFRLGWLLEMLTLYWPSIFIISGIVRIRTRNTRKFSGALQDLMIGVVLQMLLLGALPGDLSQYWPVALIVIGLWLVFIQPRNTSVERLIEDDRMQVSHLLRGSRIIVRAPAFEGGSLSATMSLVQCGLQQCKAGARFMHLDCALRMSSAVLYVPESWRVTPELRKSSASVTDNRALGNPPENGNAPELVLEGSMSFASLEIRDGEDWVELEEGEKDEED
jgi:hypothetical protein